MAYNVTTLLNDLTGVVHGTTVNKVSNIYGVINRAARAILLDVDPKETQRIVQMAQVFNNVFDYALAPDVKGDRLIDVRPQAGRKPSDIFFQGYETAFDSLKGLGLNNAIYTQWNTGIKTIRIEAPTLTAPVTLTDTSTVLNWSANNGITSLTLDQTNNVAGGGALVFNLLNGQSSGYLQNQALQQVDYTNYLNQSYGFVWVYIPLASGVTSVDLRWGSDATTNYYNYTTSVTQQGTAFQNGWNLLAFPWVSATVTGTPVITAIDSVRFTVNYNSVAQTGLKFCNLTFNLGYIFETVYYSKYLFRDPSTNVFQETLVDSTDNNKLINLDTESYNLLFNKCAYFIAQQLQGADASYDATFWDAEYSNALLRYKALNPSEAMLKSATYYSMPKRGYGGSNRWYGGQNT